MLHRLLFFLLLSTAAQAGTSWQEIRRDSLPEPSAAYQAGQQAANQAYKPDGWAIAGIYLSTLYLTPVAGLIVTLLTTSRRPRQLTYPDQPTAPAFRQGFGDGAFRKKKRKLWLHFALSLLAFGIVFLIYLSVVGSLFGSFRL
jgi:hypothetical protein